MAGELTVERARDAFSYDADKGCLIWKTVHPLARGVNVGDEAGCVRKDGYHHVRIDGIRYLTHRVIWLIATGEWPSNEIDHIDGDKLNNRFENLRDVDKTVNHQNRPRYKNNKTGFCGVGWHKASGKWRARLQVNGKTKNLGRFDSYEEAVYARVKANQEHGFHENHGREVE